MLTFNQHDGGASIEFDTGRQGVQLAKLWVGMKKPGFTNFGTSNNEHPCEEVRPGVYRYQFGAEDLDTPGDNQVQIIGPGVQTALSFNVVRVDQEPDPDEFRLPVD